MPIVYQTNKRTGQKYAYEATSVWVPELKKPRSVRTYLGRVAPDGSIIPPARRKKSAPSAESNDNDLPNPVVSDLRKQLEDKNSEIYALEKKNAKLESALSDIQGILQSIQSK